LATLSALDRNLDTLPHTRRLGCGNRCQALILSLLARLAALWLILQAFVMEKDLFTGCPDKVLTAIDAFDCAILIFIFWIRF
jgi:hypothetical protein